jgi:D-alanyl-D-alanine carboxypeptidase
MVSSSVVVRTRQAAFLAGAVGLSLALASTSADAARRKRPAAGGGYNPPYAAMVVDVNSGRVLHAENADAPRHPASVTKVMTLYLVFEQIEKGRLTTSTPLTVSANASRQAPSKLGLRPGETIEVEDAIKALVTKSANDVAVVVAENLGGSEEAFAEMMTRKARALGMTNTVYRNASGLPNPEQTTTARDLTILGRAIQDRFPAQYRYFQTRVFHHASGSYRNHNKLLGRVEGVDGIKTGFTRASGFNLLTSARTEDRHIVGAVLGGKSGASRDKIMAGLVNQTLPRAYAGGRTTPVVAEAAERPRPAVVAEASRSRGADVETTSATTPDQRRTAKPRTARSQRHASGDGFGQRVDHNPRQRSALVDRAAGRAPDHAGLCGARRARRGEAAPGRAGSRGDAGRAGAEDRRPPRGRRNGDGQGRGPAAPPRSRRPTDPGRRGHARRRPSLELGDPARRNGRRGQGQGDAPGGALALGAHPRQGLALH